MVEYSHQRLQFMVLDTFKFTQDFLSKHNLRYIAAYGTVLGAIRHNGFIPWDDDIDIYMPRNDYDKLLELNNEMKSSGYEVLSYTNNKGYYLPYAKISHMNSTIWEVKHLPFVIGAFVDVFPLDEFGADVSDKEILAIFNKYLRNWRPYLSAISTYDCTDIYRSILRFDFRNLKSQFMSKIRAMYKDRLFSKFRKTENFCIGKTAKGNKSIYMASDRNDIFKTEWFENIIEVPFEDTTIIIPHEYDAYLRFMYGDYMTPPPVEQRVSYHFHYFIDLDKRISIEDIRRIKNV